MNQHDRDIEARERAGLPVLTCPNCGARGVRHWVPEQLDDDGLYVAGYYTCEGAK